jgi:hypothetical protein
MIGRHPEMYDLPEVNLFAEETYQQLSHWDRIRSHFQDGLLRATAQLKFGAQTVKTIKEARRWLQENSRASTTDLFRKLAEWAAPKILVSGSRIYALDPTSLLRAQKAFPGARYLHLLRHPISACESIQKSLARWNLNPERCWLEPHLEIIEFLERVPSELHARLRVEDLLGAPDLYLKQIAVWLGLTTDWEAVAAMKHLQYSPFACYGPVNAKFGNDPHFLNNPTLPVRLTKPKSLDNPRKLSKDLVFADETKQYARFFGYD